MTSVPSLPRQPRLLPPLATPVRRRPEHPWASRRAAPPRQLCSVAEQIQANATARNLGSALELAIHVGDSVVLTSTHLP